MSKTPMWRCLLLGLALANYAIVVWFFHRTLTVIPNTGDEHSVLFQATIFSELRLSAPSPPHVDKFLSHYIAASDGRWRSIYPPGYPMLLALGEALGSITAAVALISSACLILVFVLVEKIYRDHLLSWTVTLLLAVSPAFRFYSASYTTHLGTLLFVLVCLYLLVRGESAGGVGTGWLGFFVSAVALGVLVRPFSMFLAFLPMAVYVATSPSLLKATGRWRTAQLLSVPLTAGIIFLVYAGIQSGRLGHSEYLETVNSGGRLSVTRNLNWKGLSRLGCMVADSAKWAFGYGFFPSGNLKDVSAFDWNLSLPLLLAGIVFGLRDAVRDLRLRRAQLLLLGVAASLVLGHLFYDKQGGRFGERRFFEAHFVFCLFVARMSLAARGLPAWRWVRLLFHALAGACLCVYIPGTVIQVRESNEERFQLFLMVQRLGIRESLIFVRDVPEFDRAFYARNKPDLSGNVYAVFGERDEAVAGMFPRRPKYLFVYDWGRRDYVLREYWKRGKHDCLPVHML